MLQDVLRPRGVLHAAVVLALLTGCTGAPGASSVASPSATASGAASSVASIEPASPSLLPFPVASLPPQSRVELTDALALAALPGGASIGTLPTGTEAIVIAGPRDVGGGTWYQLRWPPDAASSRFAWVRLDDTSLLAHVEATCPETAGGVLGMLAWDRARCFGGAAVSVEGTVGHCQGGVVLAEPEWLAYACWAVSDGTGSMEIHAAPASGIVFPDDIVRARLTGHFDDPASPTCVYVGDPDPQGQTPSASEQVFLCREAFVVDQFEVLEVIGPALAG